MILRTTPMSSPAAESGACRPPDAVGAIRKRLRPTGAPSWLTAMAGWSARPARGYRSTRSVLLRKTPRLAAGLKGYERSSHAGKITPDSESPITLTSSPNEACLPGNRQVSRKALLQRAARPNFFPSRRNTLSQTLPAFRDTVPAVPLLTQLSCAFGRIGNRIKPYSVSLPLSHFFHHGATRWVDEEVPHLDCSYCAP